MNQTGHLVSVAMNVSGEYIDPGRHSVGSPIELRRNTNFCGVSHLVRESAQAGRRVILCPLLAREESARNVCLGGVAS